MAFLEDITRREVSDPAFSFLPVEIGRNDAGRAFSYDFWKGLPGSSEEPFYIIANHTAINPGEASLTTIKKRLGLGHEITEDQVADQGLLKAAFNEAGDVTDLSGFLHEAAKRISYSSKRPVVIIASTKNRLEEGDPNRSNEFRTEPGHEPVKGLTVDAVESQTTRRLFYDLVDEIVPPDADVVAIHSKKRYSDDGEFRPDISFITPDSDIGDGMMHTFHEQNAKTPLKIDGRLVNIQLNNPFNAKKPQLLARLRLSEDGIPMVEVCNDIARFMTNSLADFVAPALIKGINQGTYRRRSVTPPGIQKVVDFIKAKQRATMGKGFSIWPTIGGFRALPRQEHPHTCAPCVGEAVEIFTGTGYLKAAPGWTMPEIYRNLSYKSDREVTAALDTRQAELAQELGTKPASDDRPGTRFDMFEAYIRRVADVDRVEQLTDIKALKKTDYPVILCIKNKVRMDASGNKDERGHFIFLADEETDKQGNKGVVCYDSIHQGWVRYTKDQIQGKITDDAAPRLDGSTETPKVASAIFLKSGKYSFSRITSEPIVNITRAYKGLMPPWYHFSVRATLTALTRPQHRVKPPTPMRAQRYAAYFRVSAHNHVRRETLPFRQQLQGFLFRPLHTYG